MRSGRVERAGSKKGTINDLDAVNIPQFTKLEIDEFRERFKKYDSISTLGITKYELISLIRGKSIKHAVTQSFSLQTAVS